MRKHNTARKSVSARGKLTVGLDLEDRSSRYCVLDEQGEVISEGSLATTKKGVAQVFGAKRRWASRFQPVVLKHSEGQSLTNATLQYRILDGCGLK